MGSCFSKKTVVSSSSSPIPLPDPPIQPEPEIRKPQEEAFKKEVFIIKHRFSHEIDSSNSEEDKVVTSNVSDDGISANSGKIGGGGMVMATPIRTSSCTKEEVDAILIQCGRLSRSSTGKAVSGGPSDTSSLQRGRKYSGSKRSFDFDVDGGDKNNGGGDIVGDGDVEEGIADRIHRHRQRHRDGSSSPHGRRRRTLSRERGGGSGGGERRVSRSPNRRSESPITSKSNGNVVNTSNVNARPGKLVSVPATVSSDKAKSGGGGGGAVEPPSAAAIKRVQVKRTVGESPRTRSPARTNKATNEVESGGVTRTTASPRARSPARTNKVTNEVQISLSRSNSRKNEQSPYRRNPLSEIDNNVEICNNKGTNQVAMVRKPSPDKGNGNRVAKEQQKQLLEEAKGINGNVAVTLIPPSTEGLKPQGITRTRSSRLSRDLDINPETLSNPNPSYTSLLLEDIHNFHQKTASAPAPIPASAFSLPACVTKARSILDAVADLNSGTSSHTSGPTADKFKKNENNKKGLDTRDPIVESKLTVSNDLMEPSLHKYVTITRGVAREGEDMEEQESSGSNSFVGGQHHWLSSSSWEPNSADSTDCYTSSRTYGSKDNDLSPLGLQKDELFDEPRGKASETKRTFGNERTGIGRGRVGSGRVLNSMPATATAAAST